MPNEQTRIAINKQTLNEIATIINTSKVSEAEQSSEMMSEEFRHAANQPPLKVPMCYSVNQIEVLKTLGNFTFAAEYETDEFIQKIVALLKKPDSTKINCLPTPWREKFRCLSLDPNDFIYMDERLVIPKALRQIIIRSLHYGHPGRDTMLATVSNVWWPRLHREVVNLAKSCPQCQNAGKNIKPLLTQKQFGKLPKVSEINQEIAIDFAGPFKNAPAAKQYLLVSVDHLSGWPEAKFLRKPTTEKVIEFLKKYIARHGIPKSIRTDPATIFCSKRFKTFCANRFIKQKAFIPKSIRTDPATIFCSKRFKTFCANRFIINERLRTNKQIILERDHSGLSEILFALRMYPTRNGKSPYKKYVGIDPNTVKKLVTCRESPISESSEVKLSPSDFESGQDSTIFVRERVRGTKLESAYKKRKGTLLDQSQHTITFLPAGKSQETIISKRDIAKADRQWGPGNEQPCSSREADRQLNQLREQLAQQVLTQF